MNNCENNFNIKKKCPKICYIDLLGPTGPIGPTGPTA